MFCENETNAARLWGAQPNGYYKDAFHEYVVHGNRSAVNPSQRGSKAGAHFTTRVEAGACAKFRLRLSQQEQEAPFAGFDQIAAGQIRACDEFYAGIQSGIEDPDARLVQRQAFAGMIWNKQYYEFDVRRWLSGDPNAPPPPLNVSSPATRTGGMLTAAASFPCPISGSIPGSRPGTWRFMQ